MDDPPSGPWSGLASLLITLILMFLVLSLLGIFDS